MGIHYSNQDLEKILLSGQNDLLYGFLKLYLEFLTYRAGSDFKAICAQPPLYLQC